MLDGFAETVLLLEQLGRYEEILVDKFLGFAKLSFDGWYL